MRPNAPWYWEERDGWYVNINGKRFLLAKGKPNKKEATEVFHRLMVDNKGNLPSPHLLYAKELCDLFLDHTKAHHSGATYSLYLYYLQSFCNSFGTIRASDIKPFHVTKWLDQNTGWKGSRRHATVTIKTCYAWAVEQGLLEKSPLAKLSVPASGRRDRVLTIAERATLLSAIVCKRFKAFVTALLETGCRPSEVAKVTASDVDIQNGVWILRNHKTAKRTGRPRIVYLSPTMVEITTKQIMERPEGSLFVGKNGQTYTRNAIRCHFRRLRAKCPTLKGVVAYTCRHTYATNALVNGVGVAQVAELLGHTSIDMVSKHYGHLAQQVAHMRQAAAKAVNG